tara:strand:- start:4168 stop:4629 length:462 start_codon:yes stop_codon:yes gene_type:complete
MSYDTNLTYCYMQQGKQLRLYKFVRSSSRIVDNQGRVTGGIRSRIKYPDENITEGLRIEYTAIEKPFVDEDPETTTNSSLTEQSNPSESAHVNLNRILSLAVVCYVRAQLAERAGSLELKEYYMKEFYKKMADNESNKNKVFIANAMKPFAVK